MNDILNVRSNQVESKFIDSEEFKEVVNSIGFIELYERFEELAAEQDKIGKIGENLSSETSNANATM